MENTTNEKSKSINNTHLLIITEWITILGAIGACVIFLNGQIQHQSLQIQQQSSRTDRLYEMFIDLLKEKK